jgi:hypothetical protein
MTYQCYATATMHHISGILRNHGHAYSQGKSTWTKKHRQWVAALRSRLEGTLQTALAIKAQHRLHKKFWHLDQHKHRHVAITAVARELCGFIWAILMGSAQHATPRQLSREENTCLKYAVRYPVLTRVPRWGLLRMNT